MNECITCYKLYVLDIIEKYDRTEKGHVNQMDQRQKQIQTDLKNLMPYPLVVPIATPFFVGAVLGISFLFSLFLYPLLGSLILCIGAAFALGWFSDKEFQGELYLTMLSKAQATKNIFAMDGEIDQIRKKYTISHIIQSLIIVIGFSYGYSLTNGYATLFVLTISSLLLGIRIYRGLMGAHTAKFLKAALLEIVREQTEKEM